MAQMAANSQQELSHLTVAVCKAFKLLGNKIPRIQVTELGAIPETRFMVNAHSVWELADLDVHERSAQFTSMHQLSTDYVFIGTTNLGRVTVQQTAAEALALYVAAPLLNELLVDSNGRTLPLRPSANSLESVLKDAEAQPTKKTGSALHDAEDPLVADIVESPRAASRITAILAAGGEGLDDPTEEEIARHTSIGSNAIFSDEIPMLQLTSQGRKYFQAMLLILILCICVVIVVLVFLWLDMAQAGIALPGVPQCPVQPYWSSSGTLYYCSYTAHQLQLSG